MKKCLAIILTLAIFLCAAPLAGFTAIEWPALSFSNIFPFAEAAKIVDSGTCGAEGDGSNLTWTLDGTGTLTVSGTGKMENYYASSFMVYTTAPWGGSTSNAKRIKKIVIKNGVTSIGTHTFRGCTRLTAVTIPDSVTSIGLWAFDGCTGLTAVTIPDSVTSIGDYSFSCCTGLTAVTIPDSMTSIGTATFTDCTGLTSVTIPDSVTSIGDYAFSGCAGLTSVMIPDRVASIGVFAFANCTALTAVTIGNSVTSIGDHAFYNCTGMTAVTIPDSVTSIGWWAFSDCTGLTSVTIPDSVTSISGCAFADCTGLTSVTIPESVTSIGCKMFEDCTGLTSVKIPDSVTSIEEYAFSGCAGLTSVTIPDSVTSIGWYAFSGCTGLTSVTIPDSVTSIGEGVFSGCAGLTSVTIPDSVTSIESHTFYGCTGLTSVSIPDSVMSIGDYAFQLCKGLTQVTIPDRVWYIGDYAFSSCTGLTSVTIPDSVMGIGSGAFSGCTGLTSITIPDHTWDIGKYAFDGCERLTIYGEADSYAQEYAASNGIPFVAVNLTDTVILNRKTLSLKNNNSGQLTASLSGAAANQKIVWTSSDLSVADVSSTGKVTAKGVGKATVTAATADGQYSAACEVTVVDKWIPVESLRLSRHEMSMSANERYQLYFNIFPWNATNRNYTVTSSDPKIVSCNGDTITAKSNGTAVITVTTEDGGLSDQLTVTVTGNDLKEAYTEIAYPMGDPVGDAPALPVNPTGKVALRMNSNWFNVDSREYQQELALLCSQMMTIGYMTKTTVKTMLNGLGFNANSDKITKIMLDQGKDSVNYYYSSKDIQIGEKTKKLVIIGFIGSHQQQWLNNFDPGTGKIHKGFQGAANEMLKILREYVKSLNVSSNDVKLMIFGHSRGAAVANLVAADLIDNKDVAKPQNIFTYAFATPSYTTNGNKEEYNRIFNIINPEDFVPKVLPVAWKYNKYGTVYVLPCKTNEPSQSWNNQLVRLQKSHGKINYKKKEGDIDFPASVNGDVNIINAITWMANYLGNVEGLYKKDLITFDLYKPRVTGLAGMAASFIHTLAVNKSFYSILQETLLQFLADNDFVDRIKTHFLIADLTLEDFKHIDNIGEFVFSKFGSGLIAYISGGMFDYDAFLNSIDQNEFIKNYKEKANFVGGGAYSMSRAVIIAIADYLGAEFKKIGFSHQAQTYAAYMEALTKEEVQQYRGTSISYFRCPVDIEVIDNATGEVVAKIVNNVIDPEIAAKDNALVVFVNGDEKTVVMPSDGDYDVRITGNDDGVMDYTVSEMDGEGNEISRTNYFDVPVTDGLLMMPDVLEEYDEDGNLVSEKSVIVNELGETEATAQEVPADDFGALTVAVETEGIGGAVGAGQYTVGDYVTLTAATDENNTFLGYYENGELLTKETDLSFVVKENRTLTAKFTDKTVAVTGVAADKEQKIDYDLQEDGSVVLLTATVQPANATDKRLVWSSSDETVATVTESGVVSLLAAGTVTMTVRTPDGRYQDAITLTVTDGATETFLPGDVDGDGEVTSGDARLALRASVQLEQYEPGSAPFLAADADKNGEIESSDARTILRVSVKLESFR